MRRVGDDVERELLERLLEDLDLRLGAVSGGVAGAQHPRQRLAALIQIGEQRVKPEGALEVHRRSFLLGVRADQRRVDVDHDPLRADTQPPRPLPCPSARRADRIEQSRVVRDPIDQPKRRRVRRDRPEQRLLITHRPQVRQAVAAVGEHHRQIPDDPARIVPAASLAHPRQRARELPRQPDPVSDLGQQRRARVRHQTVAVRAHGYRETAPIALHPQGEPPEPILQASNTRRIPARADSPAAPTTGAATAPCTIRG